ncbi:hypothetical protein BC830DRAFT_1109129 [Chytriomyces sp. MP71]|nr:hypothetical protein BC830DRAFT_1109129 [Chytriomyces sp. MP71]
MSTFQSVLVDIYVVAAVVVTIQLSLLVAFILVMETRRAVKETLTPLNFFLVIGHVAFTGVFISRAINLNNNLEIPYNPIFCVEVFCAGTGAIFYFKFSFIRSGDLIQSETPAWFNFLLTWIVMLSPFIYYSPFVAAVCFALQFTAATPARDAIFYTCGLCSSVLTLFLETSFLFIYVRFMRKTVNTALGVDTHFLIVARYGLSGCVVMYLNFFIFLADAVTTGREERLALVTVSYLELAITLTILFAMKVAIWRHKQTKRSNQGSGMAQSSVLMTRKESTRMPNNRKESSVLILE